MAGDIPGPPASPREPPDVAGQGAGEPAGAGQPPVAVQSTSRPWERLEALSLRLSLGNAGSCFMSRFPAAGVR